MASCVSQRSLAGIWMLLLPFGILIIREYASKVNTFLYTFLKSRRKIRLA